MKFRRLKPKNDFLFQRLFGDVETKDVLIDLLNAILYSTTNRKIVDLTIIENKELTVKFIDDKAGRLDVRCETDHREQIDVEVQIARHEHMDQRTLFYLGKLFVSSIKKGETYDRLKRTITINILDFEYLPLERFHSTFHLYEDHDRDFMLTDILEIHFIECPKFRRVEKDLNNPLHRWLLFLEDKLPEKLRKELMTLDVMINKAENKLELLSSDEETIRLYEAREEALMERKSLLQTARNEGFAIGRAEGRAEGRTQGKAEGLAEGLVEGKAETQRDIAIKMLDNGFDVKLVMKMTGLPEAEIKHLMNNNHKL